MGSLLDDIHAPRRRHTAGGEGKPPESPATTPILKLDQPGATGRQMAGKVARPPSFTEIGVDMSAFPSAGHLASWAALCPGNNESAGKHRSGKMRKGNRWLRTALIEAAAGASRVKNSALPARFRRGLRHRGPKKAVVAGPPAPLPAADHVLAGHVVYRELWVDYYDRRGQPTRATRRPA